MVKNKSFSLNVSLLNLFFLASSLNAQVNFGNVGDAALLQNDNLTTNSIINLCSINGNSSKAVGVLAKMDSQSKIYRLGVALLRYNLNGREKSVHFLDSIRKRDKVSDQEMAYLKSLISFTTGNRDDFIYYKHKIDSSSVYWLRLKLKENTKKILWGYSEKEREIMYNRIDRFLSNGKISVSDRVFLELTKIDIKDDEANGKKDKFDKYKAVLDLKKKYPSQFNEEWLLDFLKDCKNSSCNREKEQLKRIEKPLQGADRVFELIHTYSSSSKSQNVDRLEEQLKNILNGTGDAMEKEKLKAMILSMDEEHGVSRNVNQAKVMVLFDFNVPEIAFSDGFAASLKTSISKKELIALLKVENDGKATFKDRELRKLSETHLQVSLGALLALKQLANNIKKSFSSFYALQKLRAASPTRSDLKDWKLFTDFMEKNLLFNSTISNSWVSLPPLESLKDFQKANRLIRDLYKKHANNYSLAKWKFWISFQDEKFYELNEAFANSFLIQIVDLFSLNQFEGHPDSKQKKITDYIYANKFSDYTGSDKKLLKKLINLLSPEKYKAILKHLEDKMIHNDRSQNLRILHVKLAQAYGDAERYFNSYLKGLQFIEDLPDLDVELARKGAKNDGKAKLLEAYKGSSNLAGHLDIMPFYFEYNLIDESVTAMSHIVSRIPFPPNKEHFFVKYYNDLANKTTETEVILESLRKIQAKNKEVGLITIYMMVYELISGNVKQAMSTLENSKLNLYSSKRINRAFELLKEKSTSQENVQLFIDKFKEKYPGV